MAITIKDLANKANVSIATVSRALNNDRKVKGSTKNLILSLAAELNYKPNIIARNLVKKNTHIIGVVIPEVGGEFFTDLIKGLDEAAYSDGYHVIVASSHSNRNIVESMLSFMGKSMVDGFVLIAPSINDQIKDILKQNTTPVVVINGGRELDNIDTVEIDNFQGAYSLTNYLIKTLGYKKIAFIKGPPHNIEAIQRKAGFITALEDNDIKPKEDWIINGDFTIRSGELACNRLLNSRERPEVIFASNDMMATGCYKAINSFGLKIPDDIGVAGFDHIFLAEIINPKLTTVHVPISEIGKAAADLLLRKIKNDSNGHTEHIKISTGIIIGKSCKSQISK